LGPSHLPAEKIPQKEPIRRRSDGSESFQTDHPAFSIARRFLNETLPITGKRSISNLIVNQLPWNQPPKGRRRGEGISPAQCHADQSHHRCNLSCYGCYSGAYSGGGRNFLTRSSIGGERVQRDRNPPGDVTGGELLSERISSTSLRPPGYAFQVYTNATLMDERWSAICALGNRCPCQSAFEG